MIKSLASVSQSVSQSVIVCRRSYGCDLDGILHSGSGPENKIEFVWGKKLMTPFPILAQFLHQ